MVDWRGVATSKRFIKPAARHAQSSAWQVPIPTRVRRRKSTKLFTFNSSTA